MVKLADNASILTSHATAKSTGRRRVSHYLLVNGDASVRHRGVGVLINGTQVVPHLSHIDEHFPGSGTLRINPRTVKRLTRLAREKPEGNAMTDRHLAERLRRAVRNQVARHRRKRRSLD